MKRKERKPIDMEDLGLPRSTLRNLDAAEVVRHELDRAQREIDIVRDAERRVGFDASHVDTIASVQEDMERLDCRLAPSRC